MKTTLMFTLLCISFVSYSQKESHTLITNRKNYEHSIFSNIKLKRKVTDTILNINVIGEGKYTFNSKMEKTRGHYNSNFTTGLAFYIDDEFITYFYPITMKEIKNFELKSTKLKVKLTIYKNEPKPIIYISEIFDH